MNNKTKIKVIICMIAIVLAILVTYRITNPLLLIPEPEVDEYPVSSSDYVVKQKEKLDNIVAKFNDSKLINKYIKNYSSLHAACEGNTIIVDYKDSKLSRKYVFVLDSDELTINVSTEDAEIFDKVFKIMVEANQRRLGSEMDFSDYFANISSHKITTKAYAISIKDNNIIEYIIFVDKFVLLLK